MEKFFQNIEKKIVKEKNIIFKSISFNIYHSVYIFLFFGFIQSNVYQTSNSEITMTFKNSGNHRFINSHIPDSLYINNNPKDKSEGKMGL